MSQAIKQVVTVQRAGVIEIRSPELHEGDRAEISVVVLAPSGARDAAAARERWRRHAGSIASGDPHSADNERIDADLARAYLEESNEGS